ncbi:STM4015 family protein [Nonomuraea sp. NPDC005983]|uniref:STM4015 family protein n=1 Tax=Nonomuraea sp. NPDC005983 TaxID=3155595 RepID=UPI00339EE8DD
MIEYDRYFGYQHRYDETYAGLPVAHLYSEEKPSDPGAVAWRLCANEYGGDDPEAMTETFDLFFEQVDTARVTAIVVGEWEDCYSTSSEAIVERLAKSAAKLPALRSLFFGAISSDQAEISWIQQSDITPLLEAFPRLERLEVRGGTGLALKSVRHESLRMLRIESGGLPGEVVRAVAGCDLPALEHLELWLGVDSYGGDSTAADLDGILTGERLPALRHLGLQDSEIQDDIAAAVAFAPVVARLETLALSMGTLTDTGAEALLSGQPLTHLRKLDLHHHYLSDAIMKRLSTALPGVEVDLSGQERSSSEDDWRYVAVSE